MIFYGEYELFVDDAKQFAERARAAGVDLQLRSLPEGQHNFFLGAGRVPEIDAAVAEMWRVAALQVRTRDTSP